ncbi:unnamed protein product [Phytomonas sp. Hart1]|nr:unnamed protein product [Phytomonas sp. Hart1]|eukprot:CCW69654.1 unnamed protein product [Phytomonas sp. isolate Hart1]
MRFMGTKKSAKEDEDNWNISRQNDFYNAFTANCYSVYYYQLREEGFVGSLERIPEFFVAPNFNASAVGREDKKKPNTHTIDTEMAASQLW